MTRRHRWFAACFLYAVSLLRPLIDLVVPEGVLSISWRCRSCHKPEHGSLSAFLCDLCATCYPPESFHQPTREHPKESA
jgi:hypothetical protein